MTVHTCTRAHGKVPKRHFYWDVCTKDGKTLRPYMHANYATAQRQARAHVNKRVHRLHVCTPTLCFCCLFYRCTRAHVISEQHMHAGTHAGTCLHDRMGLVGMNACTCARVHGWVSDRSNGSLPDPTPSRGRGAPINHSLLYYSIIFRSFKHWSWK